MQIQQTRLSAKNQTVIPSNVRKTLQVKAGDTILWNIMYIDGKPKAVVGLEPEDWTQYMSGLGKHIWKNVHIKTYVDALRNEWQIDN